MSMRHVGVVLFVSLLMPVLTRADDPTLYVVGYAHLDTQWRWSFRATIDDYIPATMHDNFDRFENYPNYIFNFSGSNRYRMMKEYYPADYLQVKQYVADGRWFPAGSSVDECDANVPSAEALIRQVLYGNHFFRQEFGIDSAEFMLPDCFGFPASLPSVLAHCGLKGFSTQKLTWGSAVGIPFNVGVWVGLDGEEVVAALNPGAYVSSLDHDLSEDTTWLNRINATGTASGIYADYAYYGVGDMGGAPSPASVQWLENSVAGTGPVNVISSTSEQMFLDIPPAAISALPHYQGDMLLTQHSAGSITSQCYMKRWNHRSELLAEAAEAASVFADWLGGPAYPRDQLTGAWALVLGGQMHDILPGTSHPKAYEFSWNDDVLAMNRFASALDSRIGAIAAGLDTTATGTPLVVFNPLSIAREDVVEATLTLTGAEPNAIRVLDPDGVEVPSQIVGVEDGEMKILFVASVEPVSVSVFDVQPAAMPASSALSVTANSLENDRYIVTLNGNGDIASIYDKAASREMLSAPARLAFMEDSPSQWPAWNIDWSDAQLAPFAHVDGPATVEIVENGAARVALKISRFAQGSHFEQTIRLSAGEGGHRVEFDNAIDWQSSVCNLKATFPLSVSNPDATYNWEIGTIQRGNNDPSKYEVPSHKWFDLTDTDGTYGATVLTDAKYGSDKPDDQTVRLTLIRTPRAVGSYQDQATQDWGQHDILYGLAGHIGDWRDGQTDWQAMRLSQPIMAFQTLPHAGSLGRESSLLGIDNPRIRALAIKRAEDTDEIIVRLVELDGQPAANVHVTLPTGIALAREVDGQERGIGAATLVNGELVTSFGGYEVRTFALTPNAPTSMLPALTQQSVTLPFDQDVTSVDGESVTDGFDASDRRLPAEMLPESIAYRGITFELGPVMGSQPNAVVCDGQQVALPAGSFNRLYLLAAAANGDQLVTFDVDGESFEMNVQDWGGYVGQWDNRLWDGGVSEVAFNWPWAFAGLVPGYIRPDPVAWFASHRHNAGGNNETYEFCYLFGYAIDLPANATTLTLPVNERVHILAATIADDPSVGTTPAQLLYDNLEREVVEIPDMTPVAATGWNRDVIVEQSADVPFTDEAEAFDVPNDYAYYEQGLAGSSKGLPQGGAFVSVADSTTQVQLQPYDAPNVLFLDDVQETGTLTFAPAAQRAYERISIFAASSNASSNSTGPLRITFADSSTADNLTYNGYDWFFVVSSNGINDLGRVQRSGNFEDGSGGNPRIYQTTIDLAAMGLNDKRIDSLTFGRADGSSSARTTAIFAVSGAAVDLLGDMNCDGILSMEDVAPFVTALIDPAAYDAAYPDCDAGRADMDGDGVGDGDDLQAFVAALLGA